MRSADLTIFMRQNGTSDAEAVVVADRLWAGGSFGSVSGKRLTYKALTGKGWAPESPESLWVKNNRVHYFLEVV
jgi:hypothetical protein